MSQQFNKILAAFKNLGYQETSSLHQYVINKAMDKISAAGGGAIQFDRQVANEIWEHTPRKEDKVILRDFIQSIVDGVNKLNQHINSTEEKLKQENNPDEKTQLQLDLLSYINDFKLLTETFNLALVPGSKAFSQSKDNLASSNKIPGMDAGAGDFGQARTSQTPSEKQEFLNNDKKC